MPDPKQPIEMPAMKERFSVGVLDSHKSLHDRLDNIEEQVKKLNESMEDLTRLVKLIFGGYVLIDGEFKKIKY